MNTVTAYARTYLEGVAKKVIKKNITPSGEWIIKFHLVTLDGLYYIFIDSDHYLWFEFFNGKTGKYSYWRYKTHKYEPFYITNAKGEGKGVILDDKIILYSWEDSFAFYKSVADRILSTPMQGIAVKEVAPELLKIFKETIQKRLVYEEL
jgi:hypothetical protein